jgi:hypothetical protein
MKVRIEIRSTKEGSEITHLRMDHETDMAQEEVDGFVAKVWDLLGGNIEEEQ